MQFLKSLSFLLMLMFSTILVFSACDDDDTTPAEVIGAVEFHFNYKVNGADFDESQVYEINGTDVKFEVANFYVSNIEFHPETGDHVQVEDLHVLVDLHSHGHDVTSLTAGHYHMVKFGIGVDEAANSQSETDFTSRNADDPLAMQDPAMHWNWNAGYKFIRIDGEADLDGDGTFETPIAYHLGRNESYTELAFTLHHDIAEGDNVLEFNVALDALLAGVDFATEPTSHMNPDVPQQGITADKILTNLTTAIEVE